MKITMAPAPGDRPGAHWRAGYRGAVTGSPAVSGPSAAMSAAAADGRSDTTTLDPPGGIETP